MHYHVPVMSQEVLAHLQVKKGYKYIDATLGDGGHSLKILEQGGLVLGIDYNQGSLDRAINRIASHGFSHAFTGVRGNFKAIETIAKSNGFDEVNGIIYDLGYSSYQLDESGLGLSFLKNDPLDMRLDAGLGVTAADLLNTLSEKDLTRALRELADERYAAKFAKAICHFRSMRKFQTTSDLADLLASEAFPGYENGRIHPATRTFQALRVIINDELGNLEFSLPWAARLLLPGSRMIVISFHSGEDKVVKHFGQNAQLYIKSLYKKPLTPSEEETRENGRARSAKMRVFEKLG